MLNKFKILEAFDDNTSKRRFLSHRSPLTKASKALSRMETPAFPCARLLVTDEGAKTDDR